MSNNLKRPNASNEGYQIPFCKDLHKYCKELTAQNLADPQNTWLDRICAEKTVLEEQIPFVLLSLQAKPNFFGKLLEICRSLEHIVKENYAEFPIEVRPFGSTATNLAFKDSDLDVFLDFDGNHPEPLDQLAMTLKNIMSKNYRLFKRVILIDATVPIVKCEHQSGIRCDISFLNALGVLNSELISFILSIDERLRPFLMILKFWLKKQDLNGSGAITSYALTLMAIFFLQQLEKPILPPIQYLQDKSTQPKQIVGGWNASFVKDFTLLPSTDNRHSILGLLKGFFQYYSEFEFGIYVICPFIGQKILKTIFYQDDALPAGIFELYSENLKKNPKNRFDQVRFMCVQDPFNHAHNVTRNVPKKVLMNFQDHCGKAFAICEDEVNNRKLKKSERCDFFKHLFKPIGDVTGRKRSKKGSEIFMCRDLVLKPGEDYDEEVLRNSWCDSVIDYFYEVLTKVMKCEVEIVGGPFVMEECTEEGTVRKFICKMPFHLLQSKRRQTARQEFEFPKEMSVLEKEEMLSDYIVDELLKNEENLNLKFVICCFLKKGPSRVIFDLEVWEDVPARKNIVNETWFIVETVVGKWIAMHFENCTNRLN